MLGNLQELYLSSLTICTLFSIVDKFETLVQQLQFDRYLICCLYDIMCCSVFSLYRCYPFSSCGSLLFSAY